MLKGLGRAWAYDNAKLDHFLVLSQQIIVDAYLIAGRYGLLSFGLRQNGTWQLMPWLKDISKRERKFRADREKNIEENMQLGELTSNNLYFLLKMV